MKRFASPFMTAAIILVVGDFVARILTFGGSIVLARIYSPGQFGLFSLFVSILALASSFGGLSYHRAIPLARDDVDAAVLYGVSIAALLLMAGAMGILLASQGGFLFEAIRAEELKSYGALLPLGLVTWSLTFIAQMWLTRCRQFAYLANMKIAQVGMLVGLQIGFGIAGLGALGLILGDVVSRSVVMVWFLFGAGKSPVILLAANRVAISHVRAVIVRYYGFAFSVTTTTLLQTICMAAPSIFIARALGPEATGHWGLANYSLTAIIALSSTLTPIFYQRWADQYNNNRVVLFRSVWQAIAAFFMLGLVPALLLGAKGPQIFMIVFGNEWKTAGEVAQVLAVPFLIQFVGGPLINLLNAIKWERWSLLCAVLWSVGIFIVGSATIAFEWSLESSAIAFGALTGLAYGTYIVLAVIGTRRLLVAS